MRLNTKSIPAEVTTAFDLLYDEVLELNKSLYSFDIGAMLEFTVLEVPAKMKNSIYSLTIQLDNYKQFKLVFNAQANAVIILESCQSSNGTTFEFNTDDSYSIKISDAIIELSGFIEIVKTQCDRIEDERYFEAVREEGGLV